MSPALVVKLGGSHAGSPTLRRWLAAIEKAQDLVLVPGGGRFADAVRRAQRPIGFDDRAAHLMAVLAMTQYGLALASLAPRLLPTDSAAAIQDAIATGRVPVWLSWPMLRDATDVPANWDVTSDSLALWLASLLGCPRVLLVKRRSAAPDDAEATARALADDGLVDGAFPAFMARFGGDVWVAGARDCPAGSLDPLAPPGRRIRSGL